MESIKFPKTVEHFEKCIRNLHKPLTDFQIKIDRGVEMETALLEVSMLYNLSDMNVIEMGWVYDEWKNRSSR